jgi:hypothetical protein
MVRTGDPLQPLSEICIPISDTFPLGAEGSSTESIAIAASAIAVLSTSAGAAAQQPAGAKAQLPGDALWNALASMCGRAFEGRMVEGTEAGDKAMEGQRMVMHVRACTADELRIPFRR